MIKMLIILFQNKKRIKGVELDELNYYYTMIDLLDLNEVHEYRINKEYFQDNYFANDDKLRRYSISLINQELLEVKVERTTKKSIMYFSITDQGKEIVEKLEDEYFKEFEQQYIFVHKNIGYKITSQRKVLSRHEK